MALPLIPIAMALANAIPGLVGLLKGPKAEQNAEAVVGLAKKITGHDDPQKAVETIVSDPSLLVQYKEALLDHQLAMRQEDNEQLRIIHETLRADIVSNDPYNRRWRATFGYSVSFSWLIQFLGMMIISGWAVIFKPDKAGDVINSLAGLVAATVVLWSIALTILGYTVSKRSQDKGLQVGGCAPDTGGILGALKGIVKK